MSGSDPDNDTESGQRGPPDHANASDRARHRAGPVAVDGRRFPGRVERDRHLEKRNVVGHGIGLQQVGGEITDEEGVLFIVEQKEDEADLDEGDRIPETVGGQPTDVIEMGEPVEDDVNEKGNRGGTWRPAPASARIGSGSGSAGAFGGWVYDVDAGRAVGVGAKHVLYDNTDDDPSAGMGYAVGQPSTSSQLGEVVDGSDPTESEWCDIAYFDTSSGADPTTRVVGMGEIVDHEDPRLQTRYIRNGYRSGTVGGRCIAVDVTRMRANYPDQRGMFIIDAEGLAGDSGGLVGRLDDSDDIHGVGVHVASYSSYGFCVPFTQMNADPSLNDIEPLIDHMPSSNGYPSIPTDDDDWEYTEAGCRHVAYDPSADEFTLEVFATNTGNQDGLLTTLELIDLDANETVVSDSVSLNSGDWTINEYTVDGSYEGTHFRLITEDMESAYNDNGIALTPTEMYLYADTTPVPAHTATGTVIDGGSPVVGAPVVAVREGQRVTVAETASDGSFSIDLDDHDPATVFVDADAGDFDASDPRVTWTHPHLTDAGGGT